MSDPRSDDTRELRPTRHMPPAHPPGKRKRRAENPLAMPLWALALMLLLVFGITAGVVALVIMLGGQTAPGGEPRVIIVTAPPTPTLDAPPTLPAPESSSAPTDAPAVPVFALEGPTLVPIYLSPTPRIITIGSPVLVNIDGLNVRPSPGINNTPVFAAALGSGFNVIDGPVQSDGLTWWLIQDPGSPTRRGWAAAIYLDVFAPP